MITGGCHCGAIRYQAEGEARTHALCHCTDCRRHAGAPMVGWTMYPLDAVKVTKGSPKVQKFGFDRTLLTKWWASLPVVRGASRRRVDLTTGGAKDGSPQ